MAGTALGNEGPSSGLGLADDPVDATGGQASPGFAGLKRLQNVISRGFVHGTIAFSLGKKGDDSASHKWSCYVRGPDDFEISPFIKQVAFHLHPSFNNPTRVFKSPPYEVHEQGWGEFDIVIKIHFTPDAGLRPLEIHHALKLYPNAEQSQVPTKAPVLNEIYEELVFTDPDPSFLKRLRTRARGAGDTSALDKYNAEIRACFRPFDAAENQKQIKRVRRVASVIMEETEESRERLKNLNLEIEQLQKSLGMPIDAEANGIGLATPRAGASPGGASGASPMDLASPSSQDIKSELSPSGRTSSGGARAGARKSRKSK